LNANGKLVEARGLEVHFPIYRGVLFQRRAGAVRAVDGLDFYVLKGETLGLVGESGCGKSTTGQAILYLQRPTSGRVLFDGHELEGMSRWAMHEMRKRAQMVFQDPYASLNPRMTLGDIIAEPLIIHNLFSRRERNDRVAELLELVGLPRYFSQRYPHELSGGQRQRVGIARALAVDPVFIVCDEPVSSLDVSIQAQVINLLQGLQDKFSLTYLFISHDLSVVRHISDRIAVMYLGKIVELADRYELYHHPQHPYTQALLSAVPIPDPDVENVRERIILEGDVPNPIHPPRGCRFSTRCPLAETGCSERAPEFREISPNHWVACARAA
jgi:oligopeptide transport system ATP-binding protein